MTIVTTTVLLLDLQITNDDDGDDDDMITRTVKLARSKPRVMHIGTVPCKAAVGVRPL